VQTTPLWTRTARGLFAPMFALRRWRMLSTV
jgi:hypothetical protein